MSVAVVSKHKYNKSMIKLKDYYQYKIWKNIIKWGFWENLWIEWILKGKRRHTWMCERRKMRSYIEKNDIIQNESELD